MKRKASAAVTPAKRAKTFNTWQDDFRRDISHAIFPQERKKLKHAPGFEQRSRRVFKRLPGPQPIALTRELLPHLRHEYYVCEKSDGDRAMLFVSADSAFLVDRKFDFEEIKPQSFSKVFPHSIFDGEVLEMTADAGADTLTRRMMAFDLIRLCGKSYLEEPLSIRLRAIREQTQKLEKLESIALTGCALRLFPKQFVPKQRIKEVLTKITLRDGEYWYAGSAGTNKNDGLIFTPEVGGYLCREHGLYKWKWPEMNTVDFLIRRPFFSQNRAALYCGGGAKTHLAGYAEADSVLRSLVSALPPSQQEAVVEFGFEPRGRGWHAERLRADKAVANHPVTLVSTLQTIIDDIGVCELVRLCQGSA